MLKEFISHLVTINQRYFNPFPLVRNYGVTCPALPFVRPAAVKISSY